MLTKILMLLLMVGVFISCEVKHIAFNSSDPWEDDDIQEIKKDGKKEYVEIPDIFEVSCNLSIDEADLSLRSELEARNYKIIKVSYVSRGMKEQGRTDFWEDMRIYMICRLSDGYYVLKHNPWLVGMCPMRIYTYKNKEGKLVIGMFRPSLVAKWMGNPDTKAYEVLQIYDREFKEAITSVCAE